MKFGLILATDLNNPEINNFAPIGLGCITASIQEKLPEIEVILAENPNEFMKNPPDIIGISSSTEFYHIAKKWAQKLKQDIGTPIIIGGIHISLIPQSMTDDFDVAVIGEGDITIVELLQSILKCNGINFDKLKSIPGLYFRHNSIPITTTKRPLIQDLNTLPKINWPILPFYREGQGHIVSARGCPYKCSFCASQKFANQFRFYSADSIIKEIEYFVLEKGLGGLTFYDDLFIANKERLKILITKLKERDLLGRCRFHGQVRANLITEETCDLLQQLNFITVGIGLESFSDKILKYYNKTGITSETNQTAISLLSKYKIHVNPSIIFGAPIETKEDMLVTLRAIYENFETKTISSLAWGLLRPYPGTAIWNHAVKKKIVSENMDWQKFTDWGTLDLYLCEHVAPDEFNDLINEWITKFSLLNIDRLHEMQGNVIYSDHEQLFDNTLKYKEIFSNKPEATSKTEYGDNLLAKVAPTPDKQAIYLSGWYNPEGDKTQWIEKTAIAMFKTKEKETLSFQGYIPPGILKDAYQGSINIKFYVNGNLLSECNVHVKDHQDGNIFHTVKIPKTKFIILKIVTNKSFFPNELIPDNNDSRELSLVVSDFIF